MIRFNTNVITNLSRIAARVKLLSNAPSSVRLDLTEESQNKLDVWLPRWAKSRDFTKLNPYARERIGDEFERVAKQVVRGTNTDKKAPWVAAAVEFARIIAARIADGSGGDVSPKMKPLKAETVERKKAEGVHTPTAIGYWTGKLYHDVRSVVTGKKVKVKW